MSRFDKRVQFNDENEDRPTLNSFQQDLYDKKQAAAAERLAMHHNRPLQDIKTGHTNHGSTVNHQITAKVHDLTLDDVVPDDDGRTLGVSECVRCWPLPALRLRVLITGANLSTGEIDKCR